MVFNINADAVVQHVKTLEGINESVLPVTIRQVLTKAAFDVKQKTMPKEADRFTHRKKEFFRANSAAVPAEGFDVNTMRATVGFKPKPGDRSHSVEDLEQQENGGQIGNRAFIPLPAARTGRAWNRMVRKQMRLSEINSKIVDALDAKGANDKQRFIKSAVFAGKGGFVLGTGRKKGSRLLMYINSVKRLEDGNTTVNSTAVYSVKAQRKVTPHSRFNKFMHKASVTSAMKMNNDFIKLAEKKIKALQTKNI